MSRDRIGIFNLFRDLDIRWDEVINCEITQHIDPYKCEWSGWRPLDPSISDEVIIALSEVLDE